MRALTLAALGAFVAGAALAWPGAAWAQERQQPGVEQQPRAAQPQSVDTQKKSYLLILKKVRVSPTKADGSSWDPNGGLPDIVVRIKNLSDKTIKDFQSPEKKDTLEAAFDLEASRAKVGDQLWFEVVDKDLANDDLIGRATLTVTEDMIKEKMLDVKFGQVQALSIEFREQK